MAVKHWTLQIWHSGERRRLCDAQLPASAVSRAADDGDGAVESACDDGCGDDGAPGRWRETGRIVVFRSRRARPLHHATRCPVHLAAHAARVMSRHEHRHSGVAGSSILLFLKLIIIVIFFAIIITVLKKTNMCSKNSIEQDSNAKYIAPTAAARNT